MIAFEVNLNGKRVCVAGAEDLLVLGASVDAFGLLGRKTAPAGPEEQTLAIRYSVTGLTGPADPKDEVHVRWKSCSPLKVGDSIEFTLLETTKADRPRYRRRVGRKRK